MARVFDLATGKRLDCENDNNKNNLPIGTILKLHGYSNPDYVIIENRGISEKFPGYGARYTCIDLDTFIETTKEAYLLHWENDGTQGIRTVITNRPLMSQEEIEELKKKSEDAKIRRANEAKQKIEEEEKQRNEYETSPKYAHLTQIKDTKKYGATLSAMNIRADLKKYFPGIKFSVKSKTYAGGNSVYVSWTNGPTVKSVEEIINKYEGGSFDGMTDCYNYNTNVFNDVFGYTKYLFCDRNEEVKPEPEPVLKERQEEKKELPVTFGEYKGNKIISLPIDDNGKVFTFGKKKAESILKYLEDIKRFIIEE